VTHSHSVIGSVRSSLNDMKYDISTVGYVVQFSVVIGRPRNETKVSAHEIMEIGITPFVSKASDCSKIAP